MGISQRHDPTAKHLAEVCHYAAGPGGLFRDRQDDGEGVLHPVIEFCKQHLLLNLDLFTLCDLIFDRLEQVGNTLYLAGQIAIDPETNEVVPGTVEEETRLVLTNLQAVVEAAGYSMSDIEVKSI